MKSRNTLMQVVLHSILDIGSEQSEDLPFADLHIYIQNPAVLPTELRQICGVYYCRHRVITPTNCIDLHCSGIRT